MKTVLCYGDSDTYGYNPFDKGTRYPYSIRWTGVLKKILGDDYLVIEEGCNGRTTILKDPICPWKSGLEYLLPCLYSHKPIDLIILMLGTNDLKNCFNNLSAKEVAQNVGVLVDTIYEFTKVEQGYIPALILVSPPAVGEDIENSPFKTMFSVSTIEKSKDFPKEFKAIAEQKKCYFFDANCCSKLCKEDSLHFDEKSHKSFAKSIYKYIKSLGM